MKAKTTTQELITLKSGFGKQLMLMMKKLYIIIALALFGFNASAQCTGVVAASFSNSTQCQGSATQFADLSTTSTGTITTWTWDFGDGSPIGNTSNPSYTYASAGIFYVSLIVVNNSGCADTIVTPVTVGSASTSPTSASASSDSICVGTSSILTVNGDSLGVGADYNWYSGSCGGTFIGTGSTILVSPSSTTTYFVRAQGPCNTTSCASVTVTVNQLPVTTVSIGSQTFCSGDSPSIIIASNMTGATYSWSVTQSGVSGASAGSGVMISDILTATGTSAGTAVYTITAVANGCMGSPISATVTVNPRDDASFVYTSATYCQSGTNPTPVITGLPGGTFYSTPTGLSLDPSTGTIDIALSALGTYTITYTTNGNCLSTSSMSISINATTSSANFNYSSSSFTQNGNNPLPILGSGASVGIFTATPAGLAFVNVNTGEIDLAASAPGTYVITNTIPTSGTCIAVDATTTIVISSCISYTSILDSMFQYPYNSCFNGYTGIYGGVAYANLSANGSSSVIVNWGDGIIDTYPINHNGSTDSTWIEVYQTHVYSNPGVYTTMLTFYDAGACFNDTIVGTVNISSPVCGSLAGIVYSDANNNCAQDIGEFGISGISVSVTQGGNTYWAWTDASGNYGFYNLPLGSYTIQIDNINVGYTITCSNSLAHATTVTTGTTVENFAVSCSGSLDVSITGISLMSVFFPGTSDAILPHVGVLNASCSQTIPGQVKMVLTSCIQYATSGYSFNNPPDAIIPASTGDTLVWNVSDINNIGSFSYWDYAVNITTCTGAQLGDTACITMMVLPTTGDIDPSNNTYTRCFEIGVSYDPNYKIVEPKGAGVQGFIPANTPNLTYTVNFQNIGTVAAHNIYILDTIDAGLNINSIEILSASHGIQVYRLENRTMKFMFANIMLADSTSDEANSHGYVTYRIKPNVGLLPGVQIKNTGHIYFDYNVPVATNTTINTIESPAGINEIKTYGLLKVYPNPAKDRLIVSISNSANSNIVITDVIGKTVKEVKTNELQTQIDISDLQEGIYFIKLTQGNTNQVKKIIISK